MTLAAAVQFKPVLGAPQRNLDIATQLVFQAGLHGARLVVLPELSMSGYVLKNVSEAAAHAQVANGYQTIALHEISRALNLYVAFGYVELCEGRFYNSAAVVGPSGLVMNVRKCNLRGSDFLWASPGEGIALAVPTSFGRLGALVGEDASNTLRKTHDPNVKFYQQGAADVIAVLGCDASISVGPNASWMDLAESVGCNVVVGTRAGQERGISMQGGPCIIDRNMKVWCEGSEFADATVVGGLLL